MASHHDRLFATRQPPRAEAYYDRDARGPYAPPPQSDYPMSDRIPPRRDERAYYPPPDQRSDVWATNDPYYAHNAGFPRRSPPPVPPTMITPAPYPAGYPEYRPQDVPHYEGHPRWEPPPDNRAYAPPPDVWRTAHREPSNPRLNTTLNPTSVNPEADDRRWREPEVAPPLPHDYGQPYPPEYYPYEYRHPEYYDRPPYVEADAYRTHPQYEERAQNWHQPEYRVAPAPAAPTPPPRQNRPSAIRDYKRSRQPSHAQVPRTSEGGTPNWNRERTQVSNTGKHSRENTLSSPATGYPVDRERTYSGQSRASVPGPSSPTKARRLIEEVMAVDNGRNVPMEATVSAPNEHVAMAHMVRSPSQEMQARQHRVIVLDSNDKASDERVNAFNPSPLVQRYDAVPSGNSREAPIYVSPDRPGPSTSRPSGIPAPRNGPNDAPSLRKPGHRPQGSTASRQSVMSVHSLVSPSPIRAAVSDHTSQRAPTPLDLDGAQERTDMLQDSVRRLSLSESSGPLGPPPMAVDQRKGRVGKAGVGATSANITEISPPDSPHPASPPLIPSIEPSVVDPSWAVTPNTGTPDVEIERALAEVEDQVATTTLLSPKPPPQQLTYKEMQERTLRVMPPRPKANKKEIMDTLRVAIMARRNLSTQTRAQRVNPILMDNLTKAALGQPEERYSTSPEELVGEVLERILSPEKEEYHMSVRASLATKFAGQQESLAEKKQRLRNEYLALHERWLMHCAHLDSLFKANEMQDIATLSGRTTRRSAATLGDAVRSDLEMEQIIASLGNEDLTDPNHLAVRNVATVPDMISVEKGQVDYAFDDTNGLVDDPESFYDPRSGFYDWSPEEEEIFYKKYADLPKQFGFISSFLPYKTAAQCVLYYYIHKKRLIDFRAAANVNSGKRRKGVRKSGKQKGNALLADVAQADSKRPAGRGRRRGRAPGAAPPDSGRGRGSVAPPTSGEQPNAEAPDARPKRRRVAATPRVVQAKDLEVDDNASVDTDQTKDKEASVAPTRKRRGRKPKGLTEESPAASPGPSETKFIDVNESLGRRRAALPSQWSQQDREEFMRLLSTHGKDFKRIAASMPNKTTVQVCNYYKSHLKEWQLDKVAAAATAAGSSRSSSPDPDVSMSVAGGEASKPGTPQEEKTIEALLMDPGDRQVADATPGTDGSPPDQNGRAAAKPRPTTQPVMNKQQPYMNFMNAAAFPRHGVVSPRGGVFYASRPHPMLPLGLHPTQMHPRTASSPPIPMQSPPHASSPPNAQSGPSRSTDTQAHSQQINGHHRSISQTRPASQPQPVAMAPMQRYAPYPRMPVAMHHPHMAALSFMPTARPTHMAIRPGEYQNVLPLHMLPPGHPGRQGATAPPPPARRDKSKPE